MAAISQRVNQLYGGGVFGSFAAVPQSIPAPVSAAKALAVPPAAPQSHVKTAPAPLPTQHQHPLSAHFPGVLHTNFHLHSQHSSVDNPSFWEWTARVEFKKYELGTSFSVLIFLDQVPENPQEWHISPNYVGGHHAFVNSVANRCGNCRNQQDLVVEGFVHLNHGIAKHSGLGSLAPNFVEPYLKNNLHWRVQKVCFVFSYLQMCADYRLLI